MARFDEKTGERLDPAAQAGEWGVAEPTDAELEELTKPKTQPEPRAEQPTATATTKPATSGKKGR